MARVLIDGYNLLPVTGLSGRDRLIARLVRYHREKGHAVTIVFDGTRGGTGTGDLQHEAGVEILFSPLTVTADDLIEQILARSAAGVWVVVSSDRRIQSAARRARASFLSSEEFARRIGDTIKTQTLSDESPWFEGRSVEPPRPQPKKGPSKKLSKEERRRRKGTEKL
ncbi:MAG: NYN domain-containing protein [Pseudomonadota bacterium]